MHIFACFGNPGMLSRNAFAANSAVAADSAVTALQQLLSSNDSAAHKSCITYSGRSSSCSQKIHNLRHGILAASKRSKYVLCLDDDIQLPPGFLQMAVSCMESHPSAFMLTGLLHRA